jgi:hypothetical protein
MSVTKIEEPEFLAIVEKHGFGNYRAVAEESGLSHQSVKNRMKQIRDRAKISLISEMTNNHHEYTESQLIHIVRTLKLQDPSRWITRAIFRKETGIPDSSWTHIFGTFEEFARQAQFSLNRGGHAMEKKVAAHKSRDHYAEGNERHQWGADYLRKSGSRIKTNIIFSDTHDLLIDPFYKRVLIDSCKRIQPDRIIMNGDLFDLPEFGKYTVDPRTWDVVGRIKAVHALIEELRNACPDSEFWFIEGNHEFRLIRHLQDNTPAMRAVLSDLHGWDTKTLLGITKYEVNYVSKADLRASRVGEINTELGKNYHLFDDCYLVSHYKMTGMGYDGTNGHNHKYQAWPLKRLDGGGGTWVQLGCGHVTDAEYCNAEMLWNLGFGIVHTDRISRSVNQQYVAITHIAEVGGKYYFREDSEMVGSFARRLAA